MGPLYPIPRKPPRQSLATREFIVAGWVFEARLALVRELMARRVALLDLSTFSEKERVGVSVLNERGELSNLVKRISKTC